MHEEAHSRSPWSSSIAASTPSLLSTSTCWAEEAASPPTAPSCCSTRSPKSPPERSACQSAGHKHTHKDSAPRGRQMFSLHMRLMLPALSGFPAAPSPAHLHTPPARS